VVGVAYAMAGGGGAGGSGGMGGMGALVPLILMFVIFYFLLIRPQQKQAKKHKETLANLKKGDFVLTTGGIYGRIFAINGPIVILEIADKVRVKLAKGQVARLATPEEAQPPKAEG